ncbi:MAG: spermidine/putrescine ABC transporter substrate-binding protein [Solirubrobacterales bacterium]|nr:spermidine/putrescine ABC transporter substrate-binding protein [Solirubrobacterales bacterium]
MSAGGGLSRRQLLQSGAGAALGVYGLGALSGCTVSRPIDRSAEGQIVVPKIDGDLLIYNWTQYMDPALKSGFSDKYGVAVNEVNYDNLEAMVIKLRSGGHYDLIWPSSEYVRRLRQEGLLLQFDRNKLRNSDKVNPFFDSPWYDPNSEFSMPYTYYTTGICWRSDVVSGMTGSWNDLSNPDGAGRMFILDDFQEAIGEANLINGSYINTEDLDELEASKQILLDQKQNARGFSTNDITNLVSGSAVLHQAWNGDVVNVRNQVDNPEDFQFETCEEGVPVGTDAMSIPITARSPGTALLFIDWLLEAENAARNVAWTGYAQPVEGGAEEFAKLAKDEPSIDITLEQLANGEEYRLDDPEARQAWTSLFTEVKAA